MEVNSARISSIEEKSYNLGFTLKAMENRILRRFHIIEEKLGLITPCTSPESSSRIQSDELEQVKSDIIILQKSTSAEKNKISGIRAAITH